MYLTYLIVVSSCIFICKLIFMRVWVAERPRADVNPQIQFAASINDFVQKFENIENIIISLKLSRHFPTLPCETLSRGRTKGLLTADSVYAFRVPTDRPDGLELAGLYKGCVQARLHP